MRFFAVERYQVVVAAACRGSAESLLLAGPVGSRPWCHARDLLAVVLGLHGLRVGEVIRLRREDLLDNGSILIRTLKHGADRFIPLHRSVWALLGWFRRTHGHSLLLPARAGGAVHVNHFCRFARVFLLSEISESMRFHALRHSFAMWLYSRTNDVLLVRSALGHRRLESTLVYTDSLRSVREVLFDVVSAEKPHDSPVDSVISVARAEVDLAWNRAQMGLFGARGARLPRHRC